jgi:ABC-type sugar transport system ATPase subunit
MPTDPTGVSLELRGLTKRFGSGAPALDAITLTVPAGSFLALLGPSGCGKSTLLRCIAGLEEPDEGEIVIGGKVVFSSTKGISLPPGQRNLGMVFQSYALWPHMTLTDNVAFGLELQKVAKDARNTRAAAALADVGLKGMEGRYPSQLSGGQQQRVALARLIATSPPVFLMDEPLSNLDARLRMDMRAELRRLHDTSDALTIYVTHDQGEAMSMADTVVVMNAGRIEQAAVPDEIYARPASLFVADFVGMPRMNRVEATVLREGGTAWLRMVGLTLAVPPEVPEGPATVCFRPEDIEIVPPGTTGSTRASVDGVFPAGPEVIVNLTAGGAPLIARLMRGWRAEGAEVAIQLDPARINIFDPATGRLIDTTGTETPNRRQA